MTLILEPNSNNSKDYFLLFCIYFYLLLVVSTVKVFKALVKVTAYFGAKEIKLI